MYRPCVRHSLAVLGLLASTTLAFAPAASAQAAPPAQQVEGSQAAPAPPASSTAPAAAGPEASPSPGSSAPGDSSAQTPPADLTAAEPPPVQPAPDADEQAEAHFRVGKSLYQSGRFREAAQEWEQSHELSKRDELLYNIYVAYRDAGEAAAALRALEGYLASDHPDPTLRINLEARRKALQETVAALREHEQTTAPEEPPEQSGPEAPSTTVALEPAQQESTSLLPPILMGVGAALAAGGLVVGIFANEEVGAIEGECPDDVCRADYDLEGARSDAQTLVTATDVLLIGGLVTGSLGLLLWLVEEKDRGEAVSAACAGRRCSAALRF